MLIFKKISVLVFFVALLGPGVAFSSQKKVCEVQVALKKTIESMKLVYGSTVDMYNAIDLGWTHSNTKIPATDASPDLERLRTGFNTLIKSSTGDYDAFNSILNGYKNRYSNRIESRKYKKSRKRSKSRKLVRDYNKTNDALLALLKVVSPSCQVNRSNKSSRKSHKHEFHQTRGTQ